MFKSLCYDLKNGVKVCTVTLKTESRSNQSNPSLRLVPLIYLYHKLNFKVFQWAQKLSKSYNDLENRVKVIKPIHLSGLSQ